MMKKTDDWGAADGCASKKLMRHLFGAVVVLLMLCLVLAAPVAAVDEGCSEVSEYGAWLSADTVAMGDVFFMNITGNPNSSACVHFYSDLFSVIPNQVAVNSSETGYVYIDLGEDGRQTVAFKADGACVNYSFVVELIDCDWWYYPGITVTSPAEGYLKLNVPNGLSLNAGDVWAYANYYNATGDRQNTYVTWTIDDKSIIGLSPSGSNGIYLYPRSVGTATLYVELSDNPLINATAEIVVEETEVVGITGRHSSSTLSLGTTGNAHAYAVDQFGHEFSYNEVVWSVKNGNVSLTTSDEDKHEVIITPISVGTDTITATSISSGYQWSFDIIVVPGITSPDAGDSFNVYVDYYNSYLTIDAEPGFASAYVRDKSYHALYDEEIEWVIENESVAVVSVDTNINDKTHYVTITPKNKGTTILHAYAKSNSLLNDSVVIHVEDTIVSSVWGPHFPEKVSVGSSSHWNSVYVYDQFGNKIPGEYATVTVSDRSVLTLHSNYDSGSILQVINGDYLTWQGISPGIVTVTTSAVSNASAVWSHTVSVEEQQVSLVSLQSYADSVFTTCTDASIWANTYDQYGKYISNQEIVWTVGNESVLTISNSENNRADINPIVPGTTTIRAALKSDRTLYDEITVTVEETILSSIYLSGTTEMSLFSVGSAYAYAKDQHGNRLPEEAIGWKVDNPAILEISDGWSSENHWVNLIPKSVGSTKIHAYAVSDPSVTWNMTVTVFEPVLTKIELPYTAKTISMNTLGFISADVWDQFDDYPNSAELFWSVDNESILELSSSLSKNGREILLIPLMPGIVNLTVSPVTGGSAISETVQIEVVGHALPTLTTEFPITTYNGEALMFSGTAPAGSVIQAHIIGNGYDKYTTVTDADGKFVFSIPTANLTSGTWSLILQSPMHDGNFNIDVASDGNVYMNTTGSAVVDGAGYGTVLFGIEDGKSENAAQAFYDAVFEYGVDDWCAIEEFDVEDAALLMNRMSNAVVGAPLEISGTSSYSMGTEVSVTLTNRWNSTQVLNETTVVSATGAWNVTFNTSGLDAGSYEIFAEIPGVTKLYSSIYIHDYGVKLYLHTPSYITLDSDDYLSVGYSFSSLSGISIPDEGLDCVWNVSNESVLTISDYGHWMVKQIHPVAEGTTTITVSLADDPTVFAETEITVVSKLIPTYVEMWISDTISTVAYETFEVSVFDQFWQSMYSKNGESLNDFVTVTSTNPSVATVTPVGTSGQYRITPVSPGNTTIQAVLNSDETVFTYTNVTVVEPDMDIYLWSYDDTISVGTSNYIQAYVYDQYYRTVAMYNDEFVWSVDNPDVVKIESEYDEYYGCSYKMKVTGLSEGTANITAIWKKDSSYVAEQTVVVKKAAHHQIWLDVGNTRLTLDSGDGYLSAEVVDTYYNRIDGQPVSASVVNKSVVSITRDPDNPNAYHITPLAAGETEIVLSVKDSSVSPERVSVIVEETEPYLSIEGQGWYNSVLSKSSVGYVLLAPVDQFRNMLDTSKYPVMWEVSNSSVLKITEFEAIGYTALRVEAASAGTSNMTISMGDETLCYEFEVAEDETEVTEIMLQVIGASEESDAVYASMRYSSAGIPYPPTPDRQTQVLTLGYEYDAAVLAADQYGNIVNPESLITITADTEGIISWDEVDEDYTSYPFSHSMLKIKPLKAGTVTLTITSKANPEVFFNLDIEVIGTAETPDVSEGEAEIIVPPVITPNGGTIYHDSADITITTETEDAVIYYTLDGTTPTNNSILYEKPFTLDESSFTNGKSLVIKAVAVKDGCEDSAVVTEIYTHAKKDKPKHKVQVQTVTGGSVTLSTTESEADELISITFKADEGYTLAGWSIQGSISGSYSNKSGSVSDFSMWDEDVIIVPDYVKIIDNTPKPAAIKFQHVPSKIYENDTGALNAIVYDQFGERFANNKVTWSSSAPSVFTIDETTGVYQAKAGGIAVITATSTDNPDVSASLTLSVYVPPKPLITGEISGPSTAYYGVMSDPYIVTSEYASHLNWDFGDGTPTVKTEVNYPYPYYTSSYDTVSHTFVETGDLTVELTPSNSYREGETKTFSVHVTYAPPRNLVITDGPAAVVGGESYVYTAFATNADTYTWYLDGQVVEGQTSSVATITFPTSQNERTAEVKVAASYKDSGNCEPVTKTVTVSVAGGELGEFGDDITMNPAKPAVGDVVVFSIDKVSNAVKYLWTFEDGYTETTTAPKVSHALKDTETDSVKVTAYNSADLTKEKTYTFTAAGAKPAKPEITASKTPATAGDTITFTAASNGAKTYKWVVDGVVQESTSNTCEVFWTVDDVGKHEIAVTVSNDYGTAKNSIVYEVIAKKGKPAVIKKITGPDVMNEKGSETFNAVISCSDDYTIAWYLNNELLEGEDSKHLKLNLKAGDYVLKVVVTTEYEEVSYFEKYFKVVSKNDKQKNSKDKSLEAPENAVTPQMVDNSSSGKSAFSTIGSLTLDKDDISQDADEVSIEIAPINPEELAGFTDEMGSRQNVLMSLEINPIGLKNEKDLSKSAVITFRLLKDDIADPEAIQFYRLDTGSGIDQWVRLNKVDCTEDGDYYVFTVETAGMSQFVAAPVSLSEEQEMPGVSTVEVNNTTETFNAKTVAEVSYTLSPENIGTISAPVLAKGGLQLMIDNVVVEKIVGGSSTKVSAEVLANGAVSVSGDISDAESLKVSFIGRMLGDGTGDCKVDTSDAISALRITAELDKPTDIETFYLDVSADSKIDLDDAILLLRYCAEIIDDDYL